MKRLFILILLLASPLSLWAASEITSISGSVAHGESVTISGSGFGSKSPAAPLLWETFDGGTSGESVSGGGWNSYTGGGARYNNTQPYSGTLSAYNYVEYGMGTGFNTSYYVLPSSYEQLYMSCMFRHEGTTYGEGVEKNWRINTTVSGHYSGAGTYALSDNYIFYRPPGGIPTPLDDDYGSGAHWSAPEYGSSTWTRHQGYISYSTPPGTANGYMWAAVGTQEKTFANRVNRPEGYSYQAKEYLLGLMHDHGSLNPGEYHHMWVDDLYIDNTMARVEIGNSSTWATCTVKVIQIPHTSWGDTSIQITINRGSFGETAEAWLYVVAADGTVSDNDTGTAGAQGYPIQFGDEVEPSCADTPGLCADQSACEAAGWNWCDGTCQATACEEEPPLTPVKTSTWNVPGTVRVR
jgi:hypothetical protein